jgi:ComF family protein
VGLLDLIFPPRCGGCGREGTGWCERCAASVEPVPVTTLNGTLLVAAGRLDGALQRAIHTYKYRPRPGLADVLAEPLRRAIGAAGLDLAALTYVPLHPNRRRERGFNQAERLASAVARPLGVPLVGGLSRLRPTPAQVGLSQPERQVNMLGAFAWTAALPPPERLGLVDDVCTTGATLTAAADAVARAGGSIAAFVVLARAQTLPALAVT